MPPTLKINRDSLPTLIFIFSMNSEITLSAKKEKSKDNLSGL